MRLDKIWYILRNKINCSDEEWDGQILEVPFTCVKKSGKKLTQGLTKG